jgi:adenylate cyclase
MFAFVFCLASILVLRKKRYFALTMFFIISFIFSYFLTLFAFKHGIYTSITYAWVPLILHFLMLGLIVLYLYNQEKKVYYKELSHSHSAALESMALVAGTKDFETGEHLNRTKEYMKLLAQHLRENGIYKNTLTHEFIDAIYHAAPLHDIGKVGIPDAILQKPGKLNTEEFTIMKNHPEIGMQIISNAMTSYNKNTFLNAAYNIAYYHHEKWDGSGYPIGLKKEEIPLEARLMAIVDVYDALTTERCYKEAYSFDKAETLIINERGRHFDPQIVDAFIKIKDKFRYISSINSDKKLP